MPATYEFADFVVDPDRGTLFRRGYPVMLQDQPFRLLVLLLSRAGTVVTPEEIQAHLWSANTYVEFDKSLRVAVSKLREALRDSATQPIYIETVPRRGYRFIAEVTERAPAPVRLAGSQDAPSTQAPGANQPALSDSAPVENTGQSVRPKWFSARLIAISAAALLIVIAASMYLGRNGMHTIATPQVDARPVLRKSIAVIGLRNLNGSPEDQWLSTALSEMLSTELSVSGEMRVISGEEVARAGLATPPANTPSHQSLAQYGNRLGANMIVYGTYVVSRDHAGNAAPRLRLDLRVEDLSSDAPPMALVKTGLSTDLFTIVSSSGSDMRQRFGLGEVPADVAGAVRRTLPTDPVAAQFYAEGLSRLRNFDPSGARDLLRKAAQLEPTHAGTHLALADAWTGMGYDNEAREEAARAVELAAGLPRPELLEMQGQLAMLSNDWTKASDLFRSLFTFYPDNAGYGLRLVKAQTDGSHGADALATLEKLHKSGLSQADEARIDIAEAEADLQIDNFRQAIAAADGAAKIGADLDLKMIVASALRIKAVGLERMGNLQESLAASTASQSLYQEVGDRYGQGMATMTTGDILYDKAQTSEARKSFMDSLALFREIGHIRNSSSSLERIGNTYYDEGKLPESLQFYQQTLDLDRQLHWDAGIASDFGNIANVQDTEGDLPGALKSNQQALDLFEEAGKKRGTASTLNNMGNLEAERGDFDNASADFNRAAEIDREIGYVRGLAFARIGQGDVLLAHNDIAGALHQYDLALKGIEGIDEPEVRSDVLYSQGQAFRLIGKFQEAAADLQQTADNFVRDKYHGQAAAALAELSYDQLKLGHVSDAANSADRAVAESRGQFSPRFQIIAAIAQARVQTAQGKIAPAQEALRSSLLIAQHHAFLPIVMEIRILLAQTNGSPKEQRSQLAALAQEATAHGWKQIAAETHDRH